MTEAKRHPYLPVAPGNHLAIASPATGQAAEALGANDRWYEELTAAGAKVATYHVWQQADEADPTALRTGWTKIGLDGRKLDEGSQAGL